MSYDLRAAVGWITAIAVVISIFSYALSLIVSVVVVTATQLGSQLLPSLALAPIAEEIGFRISVLGLITGVLVAVKFGHTIAHGAKVTNLSELGIFFSAFISPGYAKERAGLPSIRTSGLKGISISEWIFLFLTAIVFGAYHVLGGAGWGPGKFLTTALTGFALGLVYLAYGAYADILLHWFFDLNFYAFSVYQSFNGVFAIFGDLATLGAVALGVWGIIVGIYWYANRKPSPIIYPTI